MASSKLRRTSELFNRGKGIALEADGGEVLTFWVMKPNSFEKDEALKDGRWAKAVRAKAFDYDERESEAVSAVITNMSDSELVESSINNSVPELISKAQDEVRADPAWEERLEALDRQQLAKDRDLSDSEKEGLANVTFEHTEAVEKVYARLIEDMREELSGLSRQALEDRFRQQWRESASINAFFEARRQTEIFYALRDCEAVRVGDEWDHTPCHLKRIHERRLLDQRAEVFAQPDELLIATGQALDELQMTPAEAGNSAAPTASSES